MTSSTGSTPEPTGPQGAPVPPGGYGTPPPAGGYSAPPSAGEGAAPQPGEPSGPGSGGPPPGGAADPSAAQDTRPPAGFDDRGRVRRGRVSSTWIGLIAATIVLILLIIFIAQNLNKPSIHFLGASGHFPLGLIVLLSAVAGVVIAAVPGSIRILQLRKALKKNTPAEQRRPDGTNKRTGRH